ncbi:MAG: Holliday junction resolvase RuvX [Ignavibacteriales bacterium]|nr:Holliday junction resolvase RuvX [Ignavibacteriales bacterium]
MSDLRRIICFDYGSKRIGVAISDPMVIIAQPLCFIENKINFIGQIENLINEYLPQEIVIGYPLNLKGEQGQKTKEVDQFIVLLEKHFTLPLIKWDERFTTQIATNSMREMNLTKKKRESRQNIDAMAAALILQGYLDYRKSR